MANGETMEKVTNYFLGIQNHWIAMKLKDPCSLEEKQ